MQHVVRKFRSERSRSRARHEQFSRIRSVSRAPLNFFGVIPTMVAICPFRRSICPTAFGRRIQAIAPETIADHDDRRFAGFVNRSAFEHASALRLHAEHGKIIGLIQFARRRARVSH